MSHGEERIRIEDLLESVADAVSALVLFASQANNDHRLLTQLATGVTAVGEATGYLVNEANITVGAWLQFEMADEMKECNTGITDATNDIIDSVKVLTKKMDDADAKQKILEAGKGIMKFMVRLLQLNDLYEITLILKQIQLIREILKERDAKEFALDEFSVLLGLLSGQLQRRLPSVHEHRVKIMMDEAQKELLKLAKPIKDALEEYQSSYNPESVKERREILVQALNITLRKAHEATKLSAKSPFDLSMLDGGFEDFDDEEVSMRSVGDALDMLAEAIRHGDEHAMESALRALRKDLESQLDAAEEHARNEKDPSKRDLLQAAIDNLRNKLNGMLDKVNAGARDALRNRDPEMLKAILSELKKATAHVLDGPSKEAMLQRAANIESLLGSLLRAVSEKDGLEAVAIVRDIASEIDDATSLSDILADNINDDQFRIDRLKRHAGELQNEKDGLGDLTSAALKGLSPDALDRLRLAMERVRGATAGLISASLLTTPQELLENATLIEKAIRGTEDANKKLKENPQGVNAAVTNVVMKVKPQLELAKGYAESSDAETKRTIGEAADALKNATADLVQAAREATTEANKPGANLADLMKKLAAACEKVRGANNSLVSSATNAADEEIKALAGKLAADIAKLREAVEKGDIQAATAAIADIKDNTRRLCFLARLIASETDDPALRDLILKASKELEDGLMGKMLPIIKSALAKPNDPKAKADFDDLLSDIGKATSQLAKFAADAAPEDKLAQNARWMNKTIDVEFKAVQASNSADATAALKLIRAQLLRHRQLGKAVAERCEHDPALGDKLNSAIDDLEEIYKEVIMATKVALADPSKNGEAAKVVEKFKKQSLVTAEIAKSVRVSRKEAEERAKVEAEKKRLAALEAEKNLEGKDEVYRAGHKVAQAVHHLLLEKDDGTPASKLARAAHQLSEAMKKLSDLANSGNITEMIMMAREIAAFVNEIVKFANQAAAECSDPHLAQELRDTAAVAKNFAIQLKIICAVKAGSAQDDPTAKKSLIICAQGLAKNVVEAVHVSQVAKLKKKLKH